MSKLKTLVKVTAFITRKAAEQPEIVVFEHPNAGIQLPSGTVEIGESPEAAVKREAKEEIGLTSLELVGLLGRRTYLLEGDEKVVTRMTKVFNEPAFDSSSDGLSLSRGSSVHVKDIIGDFSLVQADALEYLGDTATRKEAAGYVRSSLLASQIERYFFHLRSDDIRNLPWNATTDGHNYRCFWTALTLEVSLNQWQKPWLDDFYGALIESVDDSSFSSG